MHYVSRTESPSGTFALSCLASSRVRQPCEELISRNGGSWILFLLGWDDEDVNDDFIKRLQQELEAFKQTHTNKQQQQKATA